MSDKPDKIAEKMGVHAPNSQVSINTLIVGQSSAPGQEQKISWQQVCLAMLEDRRHLTSNRLLPFEIQRDLIKDDVFVDLALVQQKKADRRSEDVLPEQGSQLYEPSGYTEVERFEFNRFLTDVLGARKNEKLTIIGEPGSGKTTLLQRIAFWLLESTEDLVIWVSLGELRDKDLRDYLTEDWLQEATMYADPSIRADWEKQFNQRSVWLLLDGLDEMTVEARDALSMRGWVTQARVITTCRLNVWQANPRVLQGFETYRMLEFQLPQMEQFIQKWFHNDCASGQKLQQALNQPGKERIRDLARNPLRLTLLCSTWHLQEGNLPNTKAELYKQFVDDFYEWKNDRFPTTSGQRKQLNAKLGELAKEAINKEKTRFRLRHTLVCEILGEADEQKSMLNLALSLGWLNSVGIDPTNSRQPVYAFFHPTFQEYFAADCIDDWNFFLPYGHENAPVKNSDDTKSYRIFEPQWKEVILLWLGQNKKEIEEQKIAFIEALRSFNDGCEGFYEYRAIFLAAVGIAQFGSYYKADKILEKIIRWSFGYFEDESKKWLIFLDPIEEDARLSLAETDRQRAISKIALLLEKNEDEKACYEVANFLGKLDPTNKQVLKILLTLSCRTEHEWLRLRIFRSLVQLNYLKSEVEEGLLEILRNSQSEIYRRDAARCLLEFNDRHPEAISTLIELFQNSKDEILCWNLDIDEIAEGNLSVLKALLQVFLSTKDVVRRRQAGHYLGRILVKHINLLGKFLGLIRMQKSPLSAFNMLSKQEKPGAAHLREAVTLINLTLTAKDRRLRRQSLWRLLKMGTDYPKVAKSFLELCTASGDEQRKAILMFAETLELDRSEIASVAIELLNECDDDWLRLSIATALNKVDPENPGVVGALKSLLNSCRHENMQRRVANELKEIELGSLEAAEVLLNLMKTTQNWDIARWSGQSLGEICNHNLEIVKVLLDLLTTTSERRISVSIVYGLKRIFDKNALTLLVTTLRDYCNDTTRENNFSLYFNSFTILWHCASRMPYADFHALWHDSPTYAGESSAVM